MKFGVHCVGLSELIFKDDDAARRVERGAVIEEFTGPGRDPQLIAGVAAMSALGALGSEEFRLIEASQERLGGSQNLGSATHAVGGVVLVIELVDRVTVVRIVVRLYHNTFESQPPRAAGSGWLKDYPGYSWMAGDLIPAPLVNQHPLLIVKSQAPRGTQSHRGRLALRGSLPSIDTALRLRYRPDTHSTPRAIRR